MKQTDRRGDGFYLSSFARGKHGIGWLRKEPHSRRDIFEAIGVLSHASHGFRLSRGAHILSRGGLLLWAIAFDRVAIFGEIYSQGIHILIESEGAHRPGGRETDRDREKEGDRERTRQKQRQTERDRDRE